MNWLAIARDAAVSSSADCRTDTVGEGIGREKSSSTTARLAFAATGPAMLSANAIPAIVAPNLAIFRPLPIDYPFDSIGLERNPGFEAGELMGSWYMDERRDFLSWVSRRGLPLLARGARARRQGSDRELCQHRRARRHRAGAARRAAAVACVFYRTIRLLRTRVWKICRCVSVKTSARESIECVKQ